MTWPSSCPLGAMSNTSLALIPYQEQKTNIYLLGTRQVLLNDEDMHMDDTQSNKQI